MTVLSLMVATCRMRPSQRGQHKASILKVRRSRSDQRMRRCFGSSVLSIAAAAVGLYAAPRVSAGSSSASVGGAVASVGTSGASDRLCLL